MHLWCLLLATKSIAIQIFKKSKTTQVLLWSRRSGRICLTDTPHGWGCANARSQTPVWGVDMPQYLILFWSSLDAKLGFSNWDTTRSQFPESKYIFYMQEHKNWSPILNKHNRPWSKIPVCPPYHNVFDCANICFLKWLIFWYLHLYQLKSCLHKKTTYVSQRNLPTNPEREISQHQTMKVNNGDEIAIRIKEAFLGTRRIFTVLVEGKIWETLPKPGCTQ